MSKDSGFLSGLMASRARTLELLVAALVLGVGVNLLAGYVEKKLSAAHAFEVGVLLSLTAVIYLTARALWPRARSRAFEGFVLYDVDENALLELPWDYPLGSSVARYLAAAFAENPALRQPWERAPLSLPFRPPHDHNADTAGSRELLRQATEYFVISNLSYRLVDYYAILDADDDELVTLTHTDIPDVLLQNRFLKLFAEPMEDRAAFVQDAERRAEMPGIGETWVGMSSGGALYERFELVLPKGSTVRRLESHKVRVETPRLSLVLTTTVTGSNVGLPSDYEAYLGLGASVTEEGVTTAGFALQIQVRIVPKRLRLLAPRGWKYYRWVDGWLDDLDRCASQDRYFRDIGYSTAHTAFEFIRHLPPRPPRPRRWTPSVVPEGDGIEGNNAESGPGAT
jgi:hypothetical protein